MAKKLMITLALFTEMSAHSIELNEQVLQGGSNLVKLEPMHECPREKDDTSSFTSNCWSALGHIVAFVGACLIVRELYIRYLSYSTID